MGGKNNRAEFFWLLITIVTNAKERTLYVLFIMKWRILFLENWSLFPSKSMSF